MNFLVKANRVLTSWTTTIRSVSISAIDLARKPPKEEYENNIYKTRKRTGEPFDRRWRWTPKLAEPYNVRGGHVEWTQMPFLHRGVQRPGYFDPKTKRFIHVEEMVPDIIAPDLTNCQLEPYVAYNIDEIKTEPFDAKSLYKQALEPDIIESFSDEKHEKKQ